MSKNHGNGHRAAGAGFLTFGGVDEALFWFLHIAELELRERWEASSRDLWGNPTTPQGRQIKDRLHDLDLLREKMMKQQIEKGM